MKIIRRLNNDFVLLTFGTVLGSMIKFFYSVFSKKMVSPADYGVFSAICILSTYLNYLQLGTMNAFNRDYPQLKGAGRIEEAKKTRNVTLTYLLMVYGIVVIIAVVGMPIYAAIMRISILSIAGYIFAFLGAFLAVMNSFATSTAKMEGKFNYAALVYIIQTLLGVGLGLLLIHIFGYLGLYAEGSIASITGCILLYKYWLKDYRITVDIQMMKILLISGIPLLVNNLIWTVVGSIDKFVILGFLDTTALGYYSIATMGFSTMVLIPQTMSNVFYIKVNQEYGRTSNKVLLIQSAQKYTFLCAMCTGVICLITYYALPIFVKYVMPNYRNGVSAAQIIMLGVAVYASTMLYGNIFTILKESKALLINSISLCVFNIIFSTGFVLLTGKTVENVAVGTSLSYALYSVLLVVRLMRIGHLPLKGFFKYSWLPIICAVLPCVVLQFTHISSDLLKMGLSLLVCSTALFYFYSKEIKNFLSKDRRINDSI